MARNHCRMRMAGPAATIKMRWQFPTKSVLLRTIRHSRIFELHQFESRQENWDYELKTCRGRPGKPQRPSLPSTICLARMLSRGRGT